MSENGGRKRKTKTKPSSERRENIGILLKDTNDVLDRHI